MTSSVCTAGMTLLSCEAIKHLLCCTCLWLCKKRGLEVQERFPYYSRRAVHRCKYELVLSIRVYQGQRIFTDDVGCGV